TTARTTSIPIVSPATGRPEEGRSDFSEKTYLNYRTVAVPLMDSPELINHLERRYNCTAFSLAGKRLPVTVLWRHQAELVSPDSVLGKFDQTPPAPMQQCALFGPSEYGKARAFIKAQFETGPIKYEGVNYRMVVIHATAGLPRIDGAYGFYYDNI